MHTHTVEYLCLSCHLVWWETSHTHIHRQAKQMITAYSSWMKINIHAPTRLRTVSLCHAKPLSVPTFTRSTAHCVCVQQTQLHYIKPSQSAARGSVSAEGRTQSTYTDCSPRWVIRDTSSHKCSFIQPPTAPNSQGLVGVFVGLVQIVVLCCSSHPIEDSGADDLQQEVLKLKIRKWENKKIINTNVCIKTCNI